jgi:hypothetical protein
MLCFTCLQADGVNHVIRSVIVASALVTTLAGRPGVYYPITDGVGSMATFFEPYYVTLSCTDAIALVVSQSHVRWRS